ncbi:hypothetical protein [Salinimonas lutimaris]|uniref:hypothetical protein n=1 Tax=Salinimonas lutimaris TaxID=914153 RepID=UPI0010BFAC9D|nr:hypothetical protein [Salinimonas lutimaris]
MQPFFYIGKLLEHALHIFNEMSATDTLLLRQKGICAAECLITQPFEYGDSNERKADFLVTYYTADTFTQCNADTGR